MSCPLEIPSCKRKIMTNVKPFEKKDCPLNIKPKCALSPPSCPLLPQEESKCGYAKLMGKGGDVGIDQCPCKSCFLTPGCPVSLNPCSNKSSDVNGSNTLPKWPDKIPPCLLCTNGGSVPLEQMSMEKEEKSLLEKHPNKPKNSHVFSKCSLISSLHPLPCSECIIQNLSKDGESKKQSKTCPYLVLADVCNKNCYCPEVPSVDIGPLCPFAPKPCPCCTTPRCPLSRKPDCVLQPKPLCCLPSPRCLCGSCLSGKPSCPISSPCNVCSICSPNCNPICSLGPCPRSSCCCGKCSLPCTTLCIPNLLCDCSPLSCPLVNPCSCSSPTCPLVSCPSNCPSVCSIGDKFCPLFQPCCSSPSCIECLLKKVQCILSPCPCPLKTICPPVPPPCSLKNPLDSSNLDKDQKETVDRTFHLPTCPIYEPPCEIHKLTGGVCPFYPNPCPISSRCPFPVSSLLFNKSNETQEQRRRESSIYKNENSPKAVKFNVEMTTGNEIPEMIKSDSQPVREGSMASNSQCPYSHACGIVPSPECPAAEILSPETYRKPRKVEKKPCPLKKCMDKQGCPLSKLKPRVDCPLGNPAAICPFTEEPDCPLEELANRCPLLACQYGCTCVCPYHSCSTTPDGPITLSTDCPCTTTDGSPSILPARSHKVLLPCLNSGSILNSHPKCSSFPAYNNKNNSSEIVTNENNFLLNTITCSKSALTNESLQFDGCCFKEENISMDFSNTNSTSSECPFEPLAPKTVCHLAPPKCPLTPKPNTCPLTRKPDPCPLSMGSDLICPVKFPPCKKFPEGRCPMGNINVCDCDYPVSPCILPLQDPDVIAPPQYCFREDCCMGLPYPPAVLKTAEGEIDKGPFYQFKDTKPGKEETKYYINVLKNPPDVEIALFGKPRKRLHDNWTVVKNGEGYLRCKTIAKKLQEMGPIGNVETQYDPLDCPLDEETRIILDNRKKHQRDEVELENLKMALGFIASDSKKKKNKKSK